MTTMTRTFGPIPATAVTPHGYAKTGARLFLVPSRSEPGADHVVALFNGQTSCTCDASLYRGRCAHARAVEDYLSFEQRAAYERRMAGIADARRIVMAQLTGKPDDYLTA